MYFIHKFLPPGSLPALKEKAESTEAAEAEPRRPTRERRARSTECVL